MVRLSAAVCRSCGRDLPTPRAGAPARAFCSRACRSRGVRRIDRALEAAVLELLAGRPNGATICPSEVARRLAPDSWRGLMEPARRAARRLVAAGSVEMLQSGRAVDPSRAKGPIRLRLLPTDA